MKSFDVIICGAGPAGSTCALALAGSGLRVALIDKSTFPRNKVCGDAIAAYARKVLHTIHADYANAYDQFTKGYPVNTYRVFGPNGNHADVTSPEYGLIAKRYDWDYFLFQLTQSQSDIHFLQTQVKDVKVDRRNGLVIAETDKETLTAKVIIGCDGAHSIVAKRLGGVARHLNHHSGAVRAYFNNVGGLAPQTFELHFLANILPGYFWIFPLKEGMANVGIGALSSHISKHRINLRELFNHIIKHHPTIRDRFTQAEMVGNLEGFGLPLGSRKTTMSGDHFMLCGDAASLIDPVTGEGIGPAMVSGRYAGWQAKACLAANDFSSSFLRKYDEAVHGKFGSKHWRSHLIQKHVVTRPALINKLIQIAATNKMAKKVLSSLIS